MPAISDSYKNYLKLVRQMTGVMSASLLVESNSRRESAALLVHEGKEEPLSEFKTKSTALHFISEMLSQSGGSHHKNSRYPVYIYRSGTNEGYLLRVSLDQFANNLEEEECAELKGERRKLTSRSPRFPTSEVVWVALRCQVDEKLAVVEEIRKGQSGDPSQLSGTAGSSLVSVIALGAYMAWHTYQLSSLLRDPTSQLPGRAEFQIYLKDALSHSKQENLPIGLVFVNPDEFGVINQRLDREKGDQALAEVAERLASSLRASDAIFRYGGAVFAVVLTGPDHSSVNETAEKLRHTLTGPFLDDAVRLTFSVGATAYHPGDQEDMVLESVDLIRQAEHALNLAKLSGGGRCVFWRPDNAHDDLISLDRLSGIFTADSEKDYRNMLLLWDTIAVISSGAENQAIATEFANKIVSTLRPNRVALFTDSPEDGLRLLAAGHQDVCQTGQQVEQPSFELSAKQRELVATVKNSRRMERLRISADRTEKSDKSTDSTFIAYAGPLIARETYLGCLYLDGVEENFFLDSSDLIFLNALANQVALALDRATLAMQWKQEKERESRKLREEVRELREVLHSVKFVYRSAEMQSVLDTLSAVAPTDVTVLITGESGTGKEMLARALHERSLRQEKPFITVDCGTIAHNLIEAELFGYVKGAYTGADRASEGRIVQAEGGTLFLDEIGEVPLDIQVKLLRFVQEKEINPVGATSSRRVDVRIVAATNRDLAKEVAAGRFRGDLYYRLQVVTVTGLPLRDRPDDILPLAQYFLEKFTVQYQKGGRRLTQQAENTLLENRWPGNVRELQNTILRAVVMSNEEKIDWMDLRLASSEVTPQVNIEKPPTTALELVSNSYSELVGGVLATDSLQQSRQQDSAINFENPWQELQRCLEAQVVSAINGNNGAPVPLGRWLTEDLVLAADAAARGVARQASSKVGLAETTFRRQLEKVKRASIAGILPRTSEWSVLKPVLACLISSPELETGENIIERARQILLREVLARVMDDCAMGSALMGVTVPTFRRWTSALTA